MFNKWTTAKLNEYISALEEMYLRGVRQSTFKDQTLIFGSTAELEQRLSKAYEALDSRADGSADGGSSKRKKIIRFTTPNDGFR